MAFNPQKVSLEELITQAGNCKEDTSLVSLVYESCVVFVVRRLKKKKRGDTEKLQQLLSVVKLGSSECLFDHAHQLKLAKLVDKHFNIEIDVKKSSQKESDEQEEQSDDDDDEEEQEEEEDEEEKGSSKKKKGTVSKWLSDDVEETDLSKGSLAQRADKYVLYQQCVQSAKDDVYLFEKIYKEHYSHEQATVFREDFCGTAWLSSEWVKRNRVENIAIGVDLDAEPIEWGLKNNISKLNSASSSIFLFKEDVLKFNWQKTVGDLAKKHKHLQANSEEKKKQDPFKKAHIVCAYNYSTCLLHNRSDVIQYFTNVRKSMSAGNSLFLLDVLGGSKFSSVQERTRKTPTNQYIYLFEQESYNPCTDIANFNIHFKFNQDNSVLRKAFSFQFRKWGVRELTECLKQVGFSKVIIYWSNHDNDEIAFKRLSDQEQQQFSQSEHWTALLCALY